MTKATTPTRNPTMWMFLILTLVDAVVKASASSSAMDPAAAAATTLTSAHLEPTHVQHYERSHDEQRQRQLQPPGGGGGGGDFDRFNELFQGASINIEEDFSITETVMFIDLTMNILNIRCYEISIGNIDVSHSQVNDQNINVDVDVTQLDMVCDVDYNYKYGFLRGTGIARVTTDNNSASTSLNFQSIDFSSLPPSSSNMGQCLTDIEITKIEFFEDFTSNIVEWFERWIRDLIETEVERVACTELGSLGTTFISDMLELAEDFLLGSTENDPDKDMINDPLYVEKNTPVPSGLEPFNFQDTDDNMLGIWFDQAVSELDNMLGKMVSDPSGPKPDQQDLGINKILRSSILDENRELVVDIKQFVPDAVLFKGHDQLTETVITLNEVRIQGLDTLTKFNPLVPIGKYTLQNELSWETLTAEIDVTIDIKPSTLDDAIIQDSTSGGITERVNIDFGVENLDLEAALFLLIDLETLGSMEMGRMLYTENILPCLMSAMTIDLAGLSVDPAKINIPTLSGFVSPGIDRIITDAVEAAFAMYGGVLENEIPNIFQTSVRRLVNEEVLGRFISSSSTDCPELETDTLDGFVDFRDMFLDPSTAQSMGASGTMPYGDLAHTVMDFLRSNLLSTEGDDMLPKINDILISPFTKSQSGVPGTLMFEGNLFETGTSISVGGLQADIEIRAMDAKIENINTLTSPILLLDPVESEPHWLNNSANVGLEERPVKLSTGFFFSVASDDAPIANDIEISLDLNALNVILTALMKMAESKLLGFPLRDILDLNCWVATMPAPELDAQGLRLNAEATAALEEIVANIGQLNLNVTCVDCSSPGMHDLTELLSTPEAQASATESINNLLGAATKLLGGNFVQVQIDRFLNDANRRCPHSQDYDPDFVAIEYQPLKVPSSSESNVTYLALVGAAVLGLIFVIGMVMLVVRCVVRRRHNRFISSLPSEQASKLVRLQQRQDAIEAELNGSTVSMFRSREIPCIIRYSMPFIIMGNLALFLSGHLSLGATVNIEANLAGETISVDKFYEFSMARSTIDIWNAGGKALAMLILIFSVIWPYTKQLMTMVLWFLPPSRASLGRRGTILLWLDWLAKWSMIDIFVLVVCIAAFRVSIQSPEVLFLPEGFYSVDLLVVPLWGLYANMLAQLISQLSSHFIIHYHRKIVNKATDDFMERHHLAEPTKQLNQMPSSPSLASISDRDNKRVLWKHQYSRPHRGETEKLVVRSWVNYAVVAASLSLVVLIVLGCTFPSFSLNVLGLIGVAVESGQDWNEATTYFNVFTVVQLLIEEAQFLDNARSYIGLGSLSVIFILTVLLVPILQTLALLRTWFSPLNMRQRTRMSVTNEILQAWQYAEVYLIAIFVASWQLGPISQFMVNSYCDSLDGFFAQMVYFGLLKEEDAQCFSVQSSIESGSFILAAGAVLLALLNTFVTKAVRQYIHEKSTLEKQVLDEKFESGRKQLDDEEGSSCSKTDDDNDETITQIHHIPVLFTDTFRWLLQGDDRDELSSSAASSDGEGIYASSLPGTDNSKGGVSFDDESATIEIQYASSRSNVAIDDADGSKMMSSRGSVGPDASECGSVAPPPLPTVGSVQAVAVGDEGGKNNSKLQLPQGGNVNSYDDDMFDVMIDDAYVFDDDNTNDDEI